jgi:hypothetical protein
MTQGLLSMLAGGLIAILSSIATLFITNIINRQGTLKIYKKIVHSKANHEKTWGFYNGTDGLYFQIPLWIEVVNTSNSSKIIRNINAHLFREDKEIGHMLQINKIQNSSENREVYLANNGSYSFVIEPRSIKRYDCHFKVNRSSLNNNDIFDEVKIAYLNDKDKLIICSLLKIKKEECWLIKKCVKDDDWTLLSK